MLSCNVRRRESAPRTSHGAVTRRGCYVRSRTRRGVRPIAAGHPARNVIVGVAALGAVTLAGCGGPSLSAPPPKPTAPAPLLTRASLARLASLAALAERTTHATFQATWRSTGKGATTVVLAQAPSHQGLEIGGVAVVRTGRHAFFCSGRICVDEHGVDPLVGVLHLYDGSVFRSVVSRLGAARRAPGGARVAFFRAEVGGLASTCATITAAATSSTWCVSPATGILTRWTTSRGGFQLTGYSSKPEPSLLVRPR